VGVVDKNHMRLDLPPLDLTSEIAM
jgi:hypothetical protein